MITTLSQFYKLVASPVHEREIDIIELRWRRALDNTRRKDLAAIGAYEVYDPRRPEHMLS